MSAQEAQRRYDALGRSDWRAASVWGVALALEHVLEVELLRAFRREVRAQAGVASREGKTLPVWVGPALLEVREAATVARSQTGLLRVVLEPAFLELFGGLWRKGSVADWFAGLDAQQRLLFEERLMPFVRKPHNPRKAAAHGELLAFYQGVRLYFHVSGLGEPKPSEMRWLAAARAIEPIAGSLDDARELWEDRLRRWRPKMDREWAGWRDVISGAIPANAER